MKSDMVSLYEQRQYLFQERQRRVRKYSNTVSWLRLLFFALAVAALTYGWYSTFDILAYAAIPFISVFVWLIVRHMRLKEEIDFLQKIVQINIECRQRLEGSWTDFAQRGSHYIDNSHPYSSDLDIFGQGSLFQYLNATTSFLGERLLAGQLRQPNPADQIKPRQDAVSDLAKRLDFRQNFQAAGMDDLFRRQDPQIVINWAEDRQKTSPGWKRLLLFMPAVTWPVFALAALGMISYLPAFILIALQVIIASPGERKVLKRFVETEQAVRRLKRYVEMMRWIEQEDFEALLLKEQKKRLFAGDQPASRRIRKLANIADRNNLRFGSSILYIVLKYAVLWDLWTLDMLYRWQKSCGKSVRGWFEATAEMEVLSSLAGLHHDHPHWVFPLVKDALPFIEAGALGHPLIAPEKRVCNDISLSGPGRFFIITGSNMSGKSTYLRAVGINLVLAYAGAPVCATKFSCSVMQIYSKMHINDNLEKGISTFYGELLRMKMIIDAAKHEAPLIILMDEIFRGTNPHDRILATRSIVGQLRGRNVIGLLTTHDLELGELEKKYAVSIQNYHFTDEIRDGDIHFDYKIRPGISQTTNAVALMKLVGIEVDSGED